jgi:hypothetical protein
MTYAGRSRQGPSDRQRSEDRGQAGTDRRTFLIASGAVLGGGLIASRLGFDRAALAHEGHHPSLTIWAAARHDSRYLALAGSGGQPEIRELVLGSRGTVTLGPTVGVLPDAFTALALLSVGGRLLVAGAAPYQVAGVTSLRPALYDTTGPQPEELPLAPSVTTAFGVATAIASTDPRHLAVAIEGSDDVEQQYNAVTQVATSPDAGRTWTVSTLATGLGEGFPSHLTAAGDRLFAVTVDGQAARRGHERVLGSGWQRLSAEPAEGTLLTVHTTRGRAFELIDRSPDGVVRRFQREPAETTWRAVGTVEIGEPVLAVVAVNGAPGELVAVGASHAHFVRHA